MNFLTICGRQILCHLQYDIPNQRLGLIRFYWHRGILIDFNCQLEPLYWDVRGISLGFNRPTDIPWQISGVESDKLVAFFLILSFGIWIVFQSESPNNWYFKNSMSSTESSSHIPVGLANREESFPSYPRLHGAILHNIIWIWRGSKSGRNSKENLTVKNRTIK